MNVTVSTGQSLQDISLWLLGGTDALFALADANGLSITDQLVAGQVLVVPDGYTVNAQLVDYYSRKNLRVNTANAQQLVDVEPDDMHEFDENEFDENEFY
ncbi:MAG: LysM peptidoglycan-binding domain-containing protein [Pseudomonadota bacterium]